MTNAQPAQSRTLPRDGADLWYEVAGTGPPLLILSAGLDGAAASAPMVEHLDDRFTTIRYDRRGVGRSRFEEASPAAGYSLANHADDAAAIIADVSSVPAFIFGASIGALVGIELLTRHPTIVRAAVLHEPPLELIVTDPNRSASLDDVAERALSDVIDAARGFGQIVRSGDIREPAAPTPARPENAELTLRDFFATDFQAVRDFQVPTQSLRSVADKLTITAGSHSAGRFEALCSAELAALLNLRLTTLPTGHNPSTDFPHATAEFLRGIWDS